MIVIELRFLKVSVVFVSLLILSTIAGCGSSTVKTHPATGKVTYKGEPIENADVMFTIAGTGEGQPSTVIGMGKTDAEGRFSIRTQIGPTDTFDGAVPGKHAVTILKYIPPKGMTEAELAKLMAAEVAAMEARGFVTPAETAPARVPLLPQKYQNPTTSGLTAEVVAGGANDFPFDLK